MFEEELYCRQGRLGTVVRNRERCRKNRKKSGLLPNPGCLVYLVFFGILCVLLGVHGILVGVIGVFVSDIMYLEF